MDCIFCNIAQGAIPADVVWQDEHFLAFKDLRPKAPVHVLLVPRAHATSLNDAPDAVLQGLFPAVIAVAGAVGVKDRGYRTIVNTGEEGGQEVQHLHVHILGGKPLGV